MGAAPKAGCRAAVGGGGVGGTRPHWTGTSSVGAGWSWALKPPGPCHSLFLGLDLGLPSFLGHFKALHGEGWGHCAADQGPFTQTQGVLPLAPLDDNLRALAGPDVGAEDNIPHGGAIIVRERQSQRRASVVVPGLDGIEDAMPVREARLALEKIVDTCAEGSAVSRARRVPECLNKVALFGVRAEVQGRNNVLCGPLLLLGHWTGPFVSRTGLDWTGLDWTGRELGWAGLDRIGRAVAEGQSFSLCVRIGKDEDVGMD
jgi:hypothetical protein